ncbi:hypothetical protein [Actinoplanes regularis]|uniref:hypothetical protein n=1 Tax=Actinoplanes regularis TaxID=52697 RepID=UPI00117743C0|nr:hypothetical protein [Actinoplanes regularis]GIE87584.1 hypothetical protein Are01nite_40640 [Actinoplanes regularis]
MANRFQLWGQAGWASAEVVGETHYAKAIRALFGDGFNPQGTDITVPVLLKPDRSNRHDRNAVGVWSDHALLGHLPRPEAARYISVIAALAKRNLDPEVNAQIHGREWGEYDGRPPAFVGTIRLDLAEPHMLVPANDPPVHEHRLLPTGSALQVSGQEQHLDALVPFQRPEGECWAYVTLHEMADHLVEVRLGDTRIGDLSPKMSFELTPVLRYQAERGLVVAARAVVKSNAVKTEVLLYVARIQDLPEAWTGPAGRGATSGRVTPVSPPPATTQVVPTTSGPDLPGAGTSAMPSWMNSSDAMPTWASAPSDAQPTWMDRSELVPTWVQPSGAVPGWAASVSGPVPTIAGRTQVEEPVVPGVAAPPIPGVPTSPVSGFSSAPVSGVSSSPVSVGGNVSISPAAPNVGGPSAAMFGGTGEIAETTVIPALSAVVSNRQGTSASGSAPVSSVPEITRHAPIPPAPTGIKFQVPPGWPAPPDGWYPPESWQPDATWPPAPAGWQWWVPTWE